MAGALSSLLLVCVQLLAASVVRATPLLPYDHFLAVRSSPIVSNDNGTIIITDPATKQNITQGPATDGGGTDFSTTAIIWLAFVFAIGVPLGLGGIRLWRFTAGCGPGLALVAALWAAFVNTETAGGVAELTITLVPLGGFLLGFVLGTFDLCRTAALYILGIAGGMAVAVRVVILRPGLLVHTFWWNWFIVGACGLFGLGAVLAHQRAGITFACASIGTFLVALGIDLVVEHQAGMSRGLRFLFDRNAAHWQDLVMQGWTPPTTTYILLGVSLGLTVPLAYAQHKVFPHPFSRKHMHVRDASYASVSVLALPDTLDTPVTDTGTEATMQQVRGDASLSKGSLPSVDVGSLAK